MRQRLPARIDVARNDVKSSWLPSEKNYEVKSKMQRNAEALGFWKRSPQEEEEEEEVSK